MPLTPTQASDDYLSDSIVQFIGRSIKAQYDTKVAAFANTSEDISKKLRIRLGKPDNRDIALNCPIVAVDDFVATENEPYGVGEATQWRHYTFVLYCYPAVTTDGAPSKRAADILKGFMRSCFGGEFIRVVDFSNPSCTASNIIFCTDGLYKVRVTDPMPRGQNNTLAQERHRFDMHVTYKAAVTETLYT